MNCSRHLIAVALLLAVPSLAQAQSSSLFGNRGVQASSGTLSNGVSGNTSMSGGKSTGTQTGMTGFTGQSSQSQSGFASGAQPTSNMPGQSTGSFVGNRNSSAAGQGGQGGARAGAAGGRNSLSGLNRANQNRNRQNQNNGPAGGAKSIPIRPTQVIGFQPPVRTGEGITTAIKSDIASAVTQGRIPAISAVADANGSVTITGHVATEIDRRNAEALIRLEPGVQHVVNRITVQQ